MRIRVVAAAAAVDVVVALSAIGGRCTPGTLSVSFMGSYSTAFIVCFEVLLTLSGGSMGLWTFLEGQMLVANAFAILNEDRFLAPKGLTLANLSGGRRNSLKGQLVGLISG
ncbi:hypothetical protein MLD38_027124 [Melastoma candidum]|uniref:Uncharacterized protein n=1 Tax=Melastoma candidum TaxID=119954 RepID=A0ACB9P3U2_9MYRT|nr:hypothetical protein MLD38_027124 [Melastoma candidum]